MRTDGRTLTATAMCRYNITVSCMSKFPLFFKFKIQILYHIQRRDNRIGIYSTPCVGSTLTRCSQWLYLLTPTIMQVTGKVTFNPPSLYVHLGNRSTRKILFRPCLSCKHVQIIFPCYTKKCINASYHQILL